MNDRIDNLTLRAKLSETDKLARELIHHIEHGFIPKAHLARRTARVGIDPTETDEVTDVTIRSSVDALLASDDFARDLGGRMSQHIAAIDADLDRILAGGLRTPRN